MAQANTTFDFAWSKVVEYEGREIDKSIGHIHSLFGITKQTLKTYDKNLRIQDLTEKKAKEIAYKMFWQPYRLDYITNDYIALAVFDFLYNSNPYNATRIIQKMLGIKVTGIMDLNTISEINNYNRHVFMDIYEKSRMNYLKSLKNWGKFGKGWTKRIKKVVQGV